jgi:hypothetical protein
VAATGPWMSSTTAPCKGLPTGWPPGAVTGCRQDRHLGSLRRLRRLADCRTPKLSWPTPTLSGWPTAPWTRSAAESSKTPSATAAARTARFIGSAASWSSLTSGRPTEAGPASRQGWRRTILLGRSGPLIWPGSCRATCTPRRRIAARHRVERFYRMAALRHHRTPSPRHDRPPIGRRRRRSAAGERDPVLVTAGQVVEEANTTQVEVSEVLEVPAFVFSECRPRGSRPRPACTRPGPGPLLARPRHRLRLWQRSGRRRVLARSQSRSIPASRGA